MRSKNLSPEDRKNYERLMALLHGMMEENGISSGTMAKMLGMACAALVVDATDVQFVETIIAQFIEDRRDDSGL